MHIRGKKKKIRLLVTISFVSSQQRAQTTICSNSVFVIVLFSVALKFSRLHPDPSHE